MASVTFQILEGLERGNTYEDLPTPLTIGREEDNQIRLNDERVSRFHAKIQEDDGRIILTDLESTNGTRVNGHPVKMRVLQVGDQVLIGRCLLLYGSRDQIQRKVDNGSALTRGSSPEQTVAANAARHEDPDDESSPAISNDSFDEIPFPLGPPEPPISLSPVQAAQVSDMLAYVQSQVLRVLLNSQEVIPQQSGPAETGMLTPTSVWHELQQLEMQLALYLKSVADPSRRDDD
jgi:predicted component of type VI protein secretion system